MKWRNFPWLPPTKRGLPKGSLAVAGRAYLFLLPFEIHHTVEGTPVELEYSGSLLRLYPPFSNEDPSSGRHIHIEGIPTLPGTTPPHLAGPSMKSLKLSPKLADEAIRADAIRVDMIGIENPKAISDFMDNFLELVRAYTFQWWVTRDRRFNEGYIRHSFTVNDCGERLGEISIEVDTFGLFGIEKAMTREILQSVADHASQRARAPLSILALCDAIYFLSVSDVRRFLVEAATACEIVLSEHVVGIAERQGVPSGQARNEVVKAKFEHRLSVGLQTLLGKSFAADRPAEYEWLSALWVARNNVAHGKPAVTKVEGQTRAPVPDDFIQMAKAVIQLFMWLQQFEAFDVISS